MMWRKQQQPISANSLSILAVFVVVQPPILLVLGLAVRMTPRTAGISRATPGGACTVGDPTCTSPRHSKEREWGLQLRSIPFYNPRYPWEVNY